MPGRTLTPVFRYLRQLDAEANDRRAADADLLRRFIGSGDEFAFTILLQRHGPMVFGVCRRLLGNRLDAEDAFQATILVFLRKASTISSRETVGNWLYGVACRTALHTRTRNARRKAREQPMDDLAQPVSERKYENEDSYEWLLSHGRSARERRQRDQIFLVHVLELLRIARIQRADTHAERVQDRVPPCVGLSHWLEGRAHQLVVVERHGNGEANDG